MGFRKAIVLGDDGNLQQLQPEDVLDIGVGNDGFIAFNPSINDMHGGQAVYVKSDEDLALANADNSATAKAIGLLKGFTAPSTNGVVVTDGILDLPDWTEATNPSVALLTPGVAYYLSDVEDGCITTTPPMGNLKSLVYIGRAVSTTALEISIERPILL